MYYVARTWQLNDLHNSTAAIPWQLPHLLHNRNYSKTRPLTLNSIIFFFRHRPTLFHSLFVIFFILSFLYNWTNNYININKQFERGRSSFTTPITKNNSNSRVQSNVHIEKTKHQLLQSTLEHGSGSPLSLTSPRLFAGLLTI